MINAENYSISEDFLIKIIQLKWNYEEFDLTYDSLKDLYPINNYYLKILLDD